MFTDNRPCRRYEAKKGSFNFSIKSNGSFLIFERKVWKEYKVDELMYCMDTNYNATTKTARTVFKLCVISNAGDIKFQFSKPAAVISCICLLITILTYIFIYKLQKIIQMIIVCYCLFLMIFYVLTALVHSITDFGKYCELVGNIVKYEVKMLRKNLIIHTFFFRFYSVLFIYCFNFLDEYIMLRHL